MICTITMALEVPNDFDEQQILEDIESAIINRTCFDVVNFGDFEIANEEEGKEIRVPYCEVCGKQGVWDGGYGNMSKFKDTDDYPTCFRCQEKINRIIDYLASWLDNEDENIPEDESKEAIISYECNMIIAAIRHLQNVVNLWDKRDVRYVLSEQCGFTEEEAEYWYKRWRNGEWED